MKSSSLVLTCALKIINSNRTHADAEEHQGNVNTPAFICLDQMHILQGVGQQLGQVRQGLFHKCGLQVQPRGKK